MRWVPAIILSVLFVAGAGAETPLVCTGTESDQPAPEIRLAVPAGAVQARNPAYYISPGRLVSLQEAGNPVALVDVRPRSEYERVRIAGSRNMPLAAVAAKRHLSNRPVVLVGAGSRYRHLEKAVRRLRESGFDARVLDGGIAYWARAVPERTVSALPSPGIHELTVREAFAGRTSGLWRVVDYTEKGAARDYFRRVVRKSPEDDPSRVPSFEQDGKLLPHVLVIPSAGKDSLVLDPLGERFAMQGSVFVLDGGARAIQEFVVYQRRLLAGKWALKGAEGGCG